MPERPDQNNHNHEQKGVFTDVVVPIAQSAVAGYVGAKVQAKQPPPTDKKE